MAVGAGGVRFGLVSGRPVELPVELRTGTARRNRKHSCLTLRYVSPEVLELLMRAPTQQFPVYGPNRPAWRDQAACRGVDPNVFVPRVENDVTTEAALRLCAGCPVREPCLAFAMGDDRLVGVFGGTTTRERRELRAAGAA
jgi:WhiB family redox-sensing transcriptional regulator